MTTRLDEILDSLLKPVTLALKNNCSRLPNIKGLKGMVTGLTNEALSLTSNPSIQTALMDLQQMFADFEQAERFDQETKVREAKTLLENIREHLASDETAHCHNHEEIFQFLTTPIRYIKGVGPKIALLLKKKGVETVEDALYNLPLRYEDRRTIKRIAGLQIGERGVGEAQVIAAGDSGASLSLDMLDQLVDAVKGGKPDILLMSRRSRRKINALIRGSGGMIESDRDNWGNFVQYWDGVPIGISDWILDTHTVEDSVETATTGGTCSTIRFRAMARSSRSGSRRYWQDRKKTAPWANPVTKRLNC